MYQLWKVTRGNQITTFFTTIQTEKFDIHPYHDLRNIIRKKANIQIFSVYRFEYHQHKSDNEGRVIATDTQVVTNRYEIVKGLKRSPEEHQ